MTYITAVIGDQALSYEEIPSDSDDDYLFRILAKDQILGTFTLVNQASRRAIIPDWHLGSLSFHLPRNQSVTVEKTDNHTVYVNGVPLDDSYSQEILSTAAENYLPAGTPGIRRVRQEVSGLLVAPEILILDQLGNPCSLTYVEETGIYREVPAEEAVISRELKDLAIAAGETYCTYMVERNNARLLKHFASGTDAFWSITTAAPWPQGALETEFIRPSVSDYVRYAEDLFSVRFQMTMVFTFDLLPEQQRTLDATFFFENRKGGWKVTAMTDGDITEETRRVRLTYQYNDVILSSVFCDSSTRELYAPQITPPTGQIFTGWAEKITASDGTTTLELIFTPNEKGKIIIPQDRILEPMTLYPLFEDIPAVG